MARPRFTLDPLAVKDTIPAGFVQDPEEPLFDPAVHLQVVAPTAVKLLDFNSVPYPFSPADRQRALDVGFAYSAPFRLVSDEGVALLRRAVDRGMSRSYVNARGKRLIRGLGYSSRAVVEFGYDPDVLRLLSDMAGTPLAPHPCTMNLGQVNVAPVDSTKKPDLWHTDSIEFVCIVAVSDMTGMRGGELQVVQLPDARGDTFDRLKTDGIPPELVETVNYISAGHAVFMQGSRILHQVTPLLAALEPRMVMVNSFVSCEAFRPDVTRYHTFKYQDPEHVAPVEFTRHRAWRATGKLQFLLDKAAFGADPAALAAVLRDVADELHDTARLVSGETVDKLELLHQTVAEDVGSGAASAATSASAATPTPRSKL